MTEAPVPPDLVRVQAAVLDWHAANRRDLAFRRTTDPWAVLVAEVMAQQTQAARAAEAWLRFMDRFPTPGSLAATSPADVLRAWQGLGYNRRALALQQAARRIVERHGGRVPGDVAELEALPGVGPYTARAVAATAFGRPVLGLDTNVRRVLARAFAPHPHGRQALADALVPAEAPAAWTHALMDLGATLCRPRAPRCDACPLRAHCAFAASGGAAAPASRRRNGTGRPPYPRTARWLRGRIIDLLRDAAAPGWVELPVEMGAHGAQAVEAALAALAAEGLIERDGSARRARLPVGGPVTQVGPDRRGPAGGPGRVVGRGSRRATLPG